uniref:BRCT domain-containing protein n=1 Tax=Glycine max TaxID=3847 RepID=A0A0R0G5N7_SOYBN
MPDNHSGTSTKLLIQSQVLYSIIYTSAYCCFLSTPPSAYTTQKQTERFHIRRSSKKFQIWYFGTLHVVVLTMSDTGRSANNNGSKRSLPSCTSARENESENSAKKPNLDGKGEKFGEAETPNKSKVQNQNGGKSSASCLESKSFNKLLEGVVFVLSGFVNPERGMLRSRAMEMGAEYKPDWNSDCTLLVCAFPNTPKFRQVEADCGTIVSKVWIIECYTQRKLIEIDSYLLHAGKPWCKGNGSIEVNEGDIIGYILVYGTGPKVKELLLTYNERYIVCHMQIVYIFTLFLEK